MSSYHDVHTIALAVLLWVFAYGRLQMLVYTASRYGSRKIYIDSIAAVNR